LCELGKHAQRTAHSLKPGLGCEARAQHPPPPKWDVKALRMNVVCGWKKRCLAIYIQKRRIMEIQIFHHAKNIPNLQKNPSKTNQNPSRYYYNSIITNLKFQHEPKYHLSKILILKNRSII